MAIRPVERYVQVIPKYFNMGATIYGNVVAFQSSLYYELMRQNLTIKESQYNPYWFYLVTK